MTVAELIEKLKDLPQDLEVIVEGTGGGSVIDGPQLADPKQFPWYDGSRKVIIW